MQTAMTRQQQTQSASHQHKDHKVPNLYWRSISIDCLRSQERYVALPPVTNLPSLDGPVTYRYVRQDSQLWNELHDGMLTTGRLKQALGMHEHRAAATVGIHQGSRGSSHLLSAYFHILHTSSSNGGGSSNSGSGSSRAFGTNAAPTAPQTSDRFEESRQSFNEQLAAAAGVTDAASCRGIGGCYASLADLQQACERTALAGDLAVKMAFGKTQEAAALYCVMHLFPEARLEEVGLFQLNLQQLPPGFSHIDPSTLPPLGASPDGLLVHKLHLSEEYLQSAAALSVTYSQAAVQCLVSKALDTVLCAVARPQNGVQYASSSDSEGEAQQAIASSSSGAASDRSCGAQNSSQQGITAAAGPAIRIDGSSNGSSSQADGGSEPCPTPIAASVSDTSSFMFDRLAIADALSQQQQQEAADTTAAAASSSCNSSKHNGSMQVAAGVGSLAFGPVETALLQLLQQQTTLPAATQATGSKSASRSVSSSNTRKQQTQQLQLTAVKPLASVLQPLTEYSTHIVEPVEPIEGSTTGQPGSHTAYIREVVEIKNHCPFSFKCQRKGKKGRINVAYSFRPRGPAQRIHPQWVPQLQMHMLATGCQSALLVSRCPSEGVRVFRIWRDDTYLQTMLELLSVLHVEHVLTGVQPTSDTFNQLPAYKPFLQRTAALARSSMCIAAAGKEVVEKMPEAADGSNQALFW